MGGLLSKLMVQDSGDSLWKAFSTKPFDQLRVSADDKALLERVFFFKHEPFVKRVVFISTPHRGSTLSDRAIASAIAGLIAVPKFLLSTTFDVMTLDLDTPGDKLKERNLTSVKNLSPQNRIILATQDIPIDDAVSYHSIMGNIRHGDDADGTDGIVSYSSSHLDGAESELVVPSGHSAHYHPLAILEVRRILSEHVGDTGSKR